MRSQRPCTSCVAFLHEMPCTVRVAVYSATLQFALSRSVDGKQLSRRM